MIETTRHIIHFADSRAMPELADNSIHLIVTSPPYFDARDYGTADQVGHGDSLNEYRGSMRAVFRECLRVLLPGRKFCLNISDLPAKGPSGVFWIPLGAYLLEDALACGFELADRILWKKTPMKGFQWGSLPWPPSPLICDSLEYIHVLRKPGKGDYSYVNPENREASRMTPEVYKEYTQQIWTLPRVRLKDNQDGHIAPFPLELPLRCITLYSFVGDTILDPFGGSGTTAEAAAKSGRNTILYEINPEFRSWIEERLGADEGIVTFLSR